MFKTSASPRSRTRSKASRHKTFVRSPLHAPPRHPHAPILVLSNPAGAPVRPTAIHNRTESVSLPSKPARRNGRITEKRHSGNLQEIAGKRSGKHPASVGDSIKKHRRTTETSSENNCQRIAKTSGKPPKEPPVTTEEPPAGRRETTGMSLNDYRKKPPDKRP